jgi:hypothetical protein
MTSLGPIQGIWTQCSPHGRIRGPCIAAIKYVQCLAHPVAFCEAREAK